MKDWTRFLRRRIRRYPDSPVYTLSDSLQIYFFPLWRADLFFFRIRCRIRGMCVVGSCIRKEKAFNSILQQTWARCKLFFKQTCTELILTLKLTFRRHRGTILQAK